MDYVSLYLGQHQNRRVFYFFSKTSSFESLNRCLDISIYDSFVIFAYDDNLAEKIKESIVKYKNIYVITKREDLSQFNGYTFILTSSSDVDLINNVKPGEVIGQFEKDVDTFSIWERLRSISDVLRLARKKDDYENEVLRWEKEKDNNIELSIVFPVYNVEKYLEKCIKTVCAWNASYVEFLFVNDGSKDKSKEIILEHAKKDPRIKLLDKENGGCASAREYGFEHAKGRYLGLIDPDDFINPVMFKVLLSKAMCGSYDIAFCGYNEFYEDSGKSKMVDEPFNKCFLKGTNDKKLIYKLIAYQRIAIWREIFKKEFIETNNLHFHIDIKRHDDLPFKIETYAKANSVIGVMEPYYYYRLGREGQDVSATDQRLYVHFDIFKHLDDFFEINYNQNQMDFYYIAKIQTYHWVITKIDSDLIDDFLIRSSKDLKIENTKNSWKKALKTCFKNKEIRQFFRSLKFKKAKFL